MSDDLALRFDEPLPYGIRRVARLLVDDALKWIEIAEDDIPTTIHEIRKRCKEMRGVVRLVRDRLGKHLYGLENGTYRDIARLLSPTRDGHVLLDTFRDVARRVDQHLPTQTTHRLIREFQERDERGVTEMLRGDRLGEIASRFEVARARIERWPLRRESFELLRPGLRRVYRRGLRRMNESRGHPTNETLHDWRKRSKYLWYQARVLAQAWPDLLTGLASGLDDLSECLGKDHDLVVLLSESTSNRALNDVLQLEPFYREVLRLRHNLIEKAWTLGRRVYAEQPGAFVERIGVYVRSAQQEGLTRL